jgi:NTE family protein
LYVDGGVMDNYPIWLFDKDEKMKTKINQETLGFRLVSLNEKIKYEYDEFFNRFIKRRGTDQKREDNLFYYPSLIVSCFYNKQESDFNSDKGDHVERTILIDHCNVKMLKFNLNDEDKNSLITSGEKSAVDYVNRYIPKKIDTNSKYYVIFSLSVIGIITYVLNRN